MPHALKEEKVIDDGPDGGEAVEPTDLLALYLASAGVADADLVDAPAPAVTPRARTFAVNFRSKSKGLLRNVMPSRTSLRKTL